MFQNIEASVCVDFESDDENGTEFLADIYDHFNAIINQEHPSCQLLTQEVLEILIESKVVLPEAASRAKSNKINKEFGQKETKVNTRLLELFGKVKAKRPPKGSPGTRPSCWSADPRRTLWRIRADSFGPPRNTGTP